jgi:hypothetical protein
MFRKLTQPNKQTLIQLYETNRSTRKIAKSLGCSPPTISRWLKRSGFSIPAAKRWGSTEIELLTHNYTLLSEREIAKKLGRTESSVRTKKARLELACFKTLPKVNLNEYELGLVVGLLEGEGSLYLKKLRHPNARCGYTFQPIFEITNTKLDIVEKIRSILPFGFIKRKKRTDRKKECYSYIIYRLKDIFVTLETLRSSLISSSCRKKADLLIEFCKVRLQSSKSQPYGFRELEIYNELKRLNQKGVRI